MNHNIPNVTTLLAQPEQMPLTEAEVNSVVDALQSQGAIVESVDWLAENKACDIFFAVLPIADARRSLEELLAPVPFDAVTQSSHERKKKLLISDMDSTMINQECVDELADFVGKKEHVSAITERAMNGELDFKDALRERVALLEGLDEATLQQCYDERITLMHGARQLVQTMAANGAQCILVSGGFTFFTQRVSEAVGFHADEANILEIKNGKLTGKVSEPILDKESKVNALEHYRQEAGLDLHSVLAVGDGANDLPMLQRAGLGIAYHAKPTVRAQAHAAIDACTLESLLYIQGYRSNEIVE